ncbi:MAG: DUF6494 family protein [Anderseniella sp.]
MDDDKFNMSMRKFLKQVGVTSQQKIEDAVRASGKTSGKVTVTAKITCGDVGLDHSVTGEIDLG